MLVNYLVFCLSVCLFVMGAFGQLQHITASLQITSQSIIIFRCHSKILDMKHDWR